MFPTTHHVTWTGENRLWFEDPTKPERSDGTLTIGESSFTYTWSFQDQPQKGELTLRGPNGSLRADWRDTFHAESGMQLHGFYRDRVLRLFGTYGAGDGPDWGWRIELDLCDPDHATLRMFNMLPSGEEMLAVDLRGARR